MKKFTLSLAALAAFAMLSMDTGVAEAAHLFRGFGIHIGGRNVHLDIGRPHGYRDYPSYRSTYFAPSQHVWRNTSYFDYHPSGNTRYGNHCDYVPSHFDYHQTGHWDHGYGGHH